MKNLILVFSLLVYTSMYTQIKNVSPGANNFNNDLNKFIGTWSWISGNDSVVLVLNKENTRPVPTMDIKTDLIYGFHKFIDNGVLKEDSTPFSKTKYNDKKFTVSAMNTTTNGNVLIGSLIHTSKNKNVKFEMQYIDSTHLKLIKLENYEGVRVKSSGQPDYDPAISLPQNITLTKQ
ncbi:DUF6705 family protein [Elizabethkingia anophelis]|uniref:DUF6705 family protein n=1 Tax=Elizabethkingia anophelis TaxID=1117645 RepID=UPI00389258DB